MSAEAQAEQVGSDGSEILEVALVMVSVPKPVEVERLRKDGRDLIAGDVRGKGARIRPYLRVRGAEIREVTVPERVLGRALGMHETEPIVVQEYRPRVCAQPPAVGGCTE